MRSGENISQNRFLSGNTNVNCVEAGLRRALVGFPDGLARQDNVINRWCNDNLIQTRPHLLLTCRSWIFQVVGGVGQV